MMIRVGLSLIVLAAVFGCDRGAAEPAPLDTMSASETRADTTFEVAPDVLPDLPTDLFIDIELNDASADLVEAGALDTPPVAPPVWPSPTTTVGGERPAPAWVPTDYDPDQAWPLVLLLHGFGVTGFLQNGLFHLSPQVDDLGILLVIPEGAKDSDGDQFWDAGWCCNWDNLPLDDVGYLVGLVDEMSALYNVDPTRVYAMGHSNGAFMAYRLACEAGDRFTAIMSLAGAQFRDPAACTPSVPVGLLQVHGTEDVNVPYGGGNNYISAWDSATYWADVNGCAEPQEGPPMDLDVDVDGPETVPTEWPDCQGSLRVALWTMEGVAHAPSIYDGTLARLAVEFLLTQSRP